jgi:hypothetical protein
VSDKKRGMETSVLNYHLRTSDQVAAERVVRSVLRESGYLTQARGGWISVYDGTTDSLSPSQAAGEMHRTAASLSAGLGAPVVAFLSEQGDEDDLLVYAVYDKGDLRDEYSSRPDSFGAVDAARKARLRGKPQVLWEYSAGQSTVGDVEEALATESAAPEAGPADDMQARLRAQMQAMGMPAPDPSSVQQMMRAATEQVKNMPPATLKMMLGSMGIPVDHPTLAPLLANPAMFLQAMSADPNAMRRMSEQFGVAPPTVPKPTLVPAAARRTELAAILGIDPARAKLRFDDFESGRAAALGGQFQKL